MPRRSSSKTLTRKESLFVRFHEGNDAAAARSAGYAHPQTQGPEVAKRPHIRAALQAKQDAMVEESGKQQSHAVSVTRNAIINGLAKEATTAESDSARVSAWSKLADIYDLSAKNVRDKDFFKGWTDEELSAFAISGAIPVHFRAAFGDGKGEESTPGTSTRKAN